MWADLICNFIYYTVLIRKFIDYCRLFCTLRILSGCCVLVKFQMQYKYMALTAYCHPAMEKCINQSYKSYHQADGYTLIAELSNGMPNIYLKNCIILIPGRLLG